MIQRGATVNDLAIIPGSPADKAGLLENDIITEVNGKEIKEGNELNEIIGQSLIHTSIKLTILRKGTKQIVEVKLEKRPETPRR